MRIINKLAKYITQYGPEGLMLHGIPTTRYWIFCQKIKENKWLLDIGDPMGYTLQKLGTATDDEHVKLWMNLIKLEIENKANFIILNKKQNTKTI